MWWCLPNLTSACRSQACTEMMLRCATNNQTDMFPVHGYDPSQHCRQKWGTSFRSGWMATQFWGKGSHGSSPQISISNMKHVCQSQISVQLPISSFPTEIWTHGVWVGWVWSNVLYRLLVASYINPLTVQVTESLSESLTAILIKGGAHHLDLR